MPEGPALTQNMHGMNVTPALLSSGHVVVYMSHPANMMQILQVAYLDWISSLFNTGMLAYMVCCWNAKLDIVHLFIRVQDNEHVTYYNVIQWVINSLPSLQFGHTQI